MSKRKADAEPVIKLFDRIYAIVPDLKREGDDYGEVKFRDRKLRINSNLSDVERSRTILHEAIHAGLGDMGLTHWSDESFVGPVEYLIYHLAQNNHWLMEGLMHGKEGDDA